MCREIATCNGSSHVPFAKSQRHADRRLCRALMPFSCGGIGNVSRTKRVGQWIWMLSQRRQVRKEGRAGRLNARRRRTDRSRDQVLVPSIWRIFVALFASLRESIPDDGRRPYLASSASIAASSSGSSGAVFGEKRATTSPCLLTRNFSKFQVMSPVNGDCSVR